MRMSLTRANDTFMVLCTANGEHWCDFAIYSICGEEIPSGRLCYEKKGSMSSADYCYELVDAQACVLGHVKWDGCHEFHTTDAALHGCGRYGMAYASEALLFAFDECVKLGGFTKEDTE